MGHVISNPVATTSAQPPLIPYEERMSRDLRWALSESSEFFEGRGCVQQALRKIAARLNALGIPYAVAGGMALFFHGFRRYTEDVDIVVTRAGLKAIHEKLDGHGYVPSFAGSKNLVDTDNGVKIEFLTAADSGDQEPNHFAFPTSAKIVTGEEISYLNLPTIIERKLALSMTKSERLKDLADVQELIKILNLPIDFADKLNSYLQAKFREIWQRTRATKRRWLLAFTPRPAISLKELISSQRTVLAMLEAMSCDGVTIETKENIIYLVTTDPEVARFYQMHEESEYLN